MEKLHALDKADAWTLVRLAVENNAVKLVGPSGSLENAARLGELDAMYLLTLYNRLMSPKQPG